MYILSGFSEPLTSSKLYYNYVLINPETRLPFYIGKGKHNRCLSHFKPSELNKESHKSNTIKKITNSGKAVVIDIVYYSEDESSCLRMEEFLIESYGRRVDNSGILTNITAGGEGTAGIIYTAEQLDQMRIRMTGSNNHMYNKSHSEHSKKLMGETRRKKFENKEIFPTKHSDEHRYKLTIHNPGGVATSKPIYQIDSVTGIILKEWESASHASSTLQLKSRHNINAAATIYKNRLVYGYYWRYVDDNDIVDNKLSNIVDLNINRTTPYGKQIIQLDSSNNVIKIWSSILSASKECTISRDNIYKAIKTNTLLLGYYWKRL